LNSLYLNNDNLQIVQNAGKSFICNLREKLANASEGRSFMNRMGRGYVLREPRVE
jgi:DNA-binding response OmpR family regulator